MRTLAGLVFSDSLSASKTEQAPNGAFSFSSQPFPHMAPVAEPSLVISASSAYQAQHSTNG